MRKTRNNTHQPVFDVSFHDHEIEKSSDHMPALTLSSFSFIKIATI